jgi:hypothetical protein
MNGNTGSDPSLAALRPWPFGPPLRGRAPRGEAGVRAAHGRNIPANGPRVGGQATAPVGGLAGLPSLRSAL